MKKLAFVFLTIFLFQINKMNAQITLDREVDSLFLGSQFKAVQISPTETKYYFADSTANTFSLYNMDFTPFMLNIAVPEPFAMTTSDLQALYITRALFDCDTSNIEYAYTAPLDFSKPFRIVRTDGTILFQLDSANGPYCYGSCLGGSDVIRPIINTSDGTKLFLQKYNLGYQQTFIYSLCGSIPTDVFDLTQQKQTYVTVFPNPTSGSLTFQINPPDNIREYEIVILDNNMKEVKREKLRPQNRNYLLDATNYSAGAYFYSLCTKEKSYQSGKFILTK